MGLFSAIQNAVQKRKEDAQIEAAPTIRRIEESDLSYGAQVVCERISHLSLAAKPIAMQAYRRKIECTGSDEIYRAFDEMYERYKRRGDTIALNVAQWLGQELEKRYDYRVETKGGEDGSRPLYVPRGH